MNSIKYPKNLENYLAKVKPYDKYMRSLLINYGFTPLKPFDLMVLQFLQVFKNSKDIENADHGFFSDAWGGIVKFAAGAVSFVKSYFLKGSNGGGNDGITMEKILLIQQQQAAQAKAEMQNVLMYAGIGIGLLITLKIMKIF